MVAVHNQCLLSQDSQSLIAPGNQTMSGVSQRACSNESNSEGNNTLGEDPDCDTDTTDYLLPKGPYDNLQVPMPVLIDPGPAKSMYAEVADMKRQIESLQRSFNDCKNATDKVQKYLEGLAPWAKEISERMNHLLVEVYGHKPGEERVRTTKS
ncbi:hypothetical protein ABW20_dc0110558 [Dactylellina cionopaga]|nr:hypothetical protein ABW20_dc0110558 [Dactylellina cionopaga]